MSENQIFSDEDYLRIHLENLDSKIQIKNTPQQPHIEQEVPKQDMSRSTDLSFFSFDINEFPCSVFYPKGTLIQIRAATVKEIQAYSMVDDTNYYDIIEKMNDILSSCVRIKHIDNTIGSYLELKDSDRIYSLFIIRELTFQKGTTLSTTAKCSCGLDVKIDLMRINFTHHNVDDKLKPYFDHMRSCFKFELTNNRTFYMSPPTIGVQKAFTEYVIKEKIQKRKPNLSFLKIVPFLSVGRTSLSQEELLEELEKFERIDDVSFQFLNSAVEKMNFGIENLKKTCQCGLEIHTKMTFPDGPSTIFIVHDAFDKFIKK